MNNLVSMARLARERLAQGLASLQAPGVPTHLLNAAEPVALAMGALHRIEASDGNSAAEAIPQALEAARRALSQLQGQDIQHPAVDLAIDAVAESLSLVHELTEAAFPPRYPPAQQAPAHPQQLGAPEYAPPQQPAQYSPPQQPPQHDAAPQQPSPYSPPQALPQYARPQAAAQTRGAPYRPPGAPPPAPAAELVRVDAEMGAHSATNFYKGLSGQDVVDSGGIFIATYQPPEIGQHVLIHMSLPGGYEFDAKGVVRWTRATSGSGSGSGQHAPPGFGAQFTELPAEARELIRRYVRNREPLFHDDF